MKYPALFPLTFILSLALAGQSLDLTNGASLLAASNAAANNLISYYTPNSNGAIPSNGGSDASSIQWYECGRLSRRSNALKE